MSNENSFYYFNEQTSPEVGNEPISVQLRKDPTGGFAHWVEFDTCLHQFGILGRNPRQYLGDNIWDCIQSEKIQAQLKRNGWFGEQDHPWSRIDKQELSKKRITNVDMGNRSHAISQPRISGDKLYAHIATAATEAGRGMRDEIIRGMIPCFSCRCFGGLRIIDKKPTVMANLLVTYDWVLYPSFDAAHAISKPTVSVGKMALTESADSIQYPGICIPWEEIAKDIGEEDQTVGQFLESYGLDIKDIEGFTDDHRHAIINNGDMTIFAGISKKSMDTVRDFYKSFDI